VRGSVAGFVLEWLQREGDVQVRRCDEASGKPATLSLSLSLSVALSLFIAVE